MRPGPAARVIISCSAQSIDIDRPPWVIYYRIVAVNHRSGIDRRRIDGRRIDRSVGRVAIGRIIVGWVVAIGWIVAIIIASWREPVVVASKAMVITE